MLNIATNKLSLLPYMPYLNHELIIGCSAGSKLFVLIKQKGHSEIIIQIFDLSLNQWQAIKSEEEVCNSNVTGSIGVAYVEKLDGVLIYGNIKYTYLFKLSTMKLEEFAPSMPLSKQTLLCNYLPVISQEKVYIQTRGINKENKAESFIYWQNKINVFDLEKKLWKIFSF